MTTKRAFVTVGSTHFDQLIQEATKDEILEILYDLGYRYLTIQIGKGSVVPQEGTFNGIEVKVFRYKNSLDEDFSNADLVISHAGAGSCIEALEANCTLVAVVNDSLMDNHQEELAEALAGEGFSLWCYPENLQSTLRELPNKNFSPYIPGNPKSLVEYIDSMFF